MDLLCHYCRHKNCPVLAVVKKTWRQHVSTAPIDVNFTEISDHRQGFFWYTELKILIFATGQTIPKAVLLQYRL